MIRPSDPDAIPLSELAEAIRVARRTVYEWALHGRRGVRLETVKVGRNRRSTMEAVERFLAAVDAADPRSGKSNPAKPGPSQATLRADAALEAVGV